jgi:UDP-glucose 4-epimerase
VTSKSFFLVGGAGFIGIHLARHLLGPPHDGIVTIFDNMSSGREWHFSDLLPNPRFAFVRGDVADLAALTATMRGHDTVFHLASNPDIAKAQVDPTIDFYQGTLLTQQVVESMRRSGAKTILYASGSGVYGDLGFVEAKEEDAGALPISTYGASKLAGESLISAYCYMFDLRGRSFRFGNVVGPRQTHGVGFDFIKRLLADPTHLDILGDGRQSKSYIHVDDVIRAMLMAYGNCDKTYEVYNVATGDYITVREIAELAVTVAGLTPEKVEFRFSGGDRGWKGDVPVVRLATDRIRKLDWRCERTSREAMLSAMSSMLVDFRSGQMK